MTNNEVQALVEKYFKAEGYQFSKHFEHRFDEDSSAVLYSLIREYKPRICLSIGTWHGGSCCVIMAALQRNKKEFLFVASELLDDMRESTRKNVFDKCNQTPIMIGDITKSLEEIPKSLDFLFVDTDHDKETTEFIVNNIFPRLKKGALVVIHDFAVEEIEGKWVGKGDQGKGGLEETQYYMDMYHKGEWPFKKLYWAYKNPFYEGGNPHWESSFWLRV